MRQVKFTQDFTFNTHGGKGGRISASEKDVRSFPDRLADKLVNHWDVAEYHQASPKASKPTEPSNTKPASPSEHKATHIGGGWYEITKDGKVVDKVRGKDNKNETLKQLNG